MQLGRALISDESDLEAIATFVKDVYQFHVHQGEQRKWEIKFEYDDSHSLQCNLNCHGAERLMGLLQNDVFGSNYPDADKSSVDGTAASTAGVTHAILAMDLRDNQIHLLDRNLTIEESYAMTDMMRRSKSTSLKILFV